MGIIIETPPEGGGSGSSGAARASLGELSIQKESVGLFIGNQAASAGMPLFLRSQPEGIKYFNGWEAGLTSLDSSNAERFESEYASNLLDHPYNCNAIKLTNDIAAVAYGNYTDINKVVYQSENGGMYQPWTYTYNNYSVPSYTKFSSDFILPLISKGFSQLVNSNGSINEDNTDFSNVFILVEYDGYTTGAAREITTQALDKGSFELFTYQTNPGSNNQSGTFYFDSNLDLVFLKSKYSISNYSSELATGTTGVRLSLDSVALDRANLQAQADKYRLTHPTTDFTYGFVGIKKVSIIKYTPVVECGKVDLYTRKSGRITSEFTLGKVQSVGHGLKNGDIIKISGARNTYGKDTVLNGLKYVQVNTTDIFSLYEDPDMGRKTETVAGSPDANWICVGNVYTNYLPDGWELKKTIFSPTGRNGYCVKTDDPDDAHYVTYGQEKNTSLKSEFSDCTSMYDLFVKDLGYEITYQYAVLNETVEYDPFVSKIPVRAYPSSLDFLWSREDQYISSYKFGCDIDLKLIEGVYYLLVGERGIESHFMYPSTRTTILPANTPTGRAHLFVLSLDSNKNLTYSHQKTFSAISGDTSISKPDQISANTDNYVNCYILSSQNTNSASYNIDQQQVLLTKYVSTDKFLTDDYWFGAYLFHFDIFNSTSYNGDFPYRCAYFSNFCPPDLTFTTNGYGYVNRVLFSHDMYPYCDSFGKSVCLSNDSSGLIIIASSKNKTQLYANNHIYTINNFATTRSHISCIPAPYNDIYSGVDCGYVHCITYSGSVVNKINKLSHPGVQTISGGIDPQYVRSESFAKTIRVHNGILYFGCSRAEEFYDTKYFTTSDPNVPVNVSPLNDPVTIDDYLYHSTATSVPIFSNEKSCIYSYSYANGAYSLLRKIESENFNNHYYQVQVLPNTVGRNIDYCPNQKSLTIQNKKYRNRRVYDHTSYEYGDVLFFPSDRFGDYFDINKSLLVTNSLDIVNDIGILHTDIAEGPDRACDYIHIYENVSGSWKIVSKISATINSTDSRYSYESLYDNGSDCISSLRNLGNYNFSNSSSSSKTWDIDLTNSYVIADDRVVLKDPFGYSVFRRQPGKEISAGTVFSEAHPRVTSPVYPYFKFDEHFLATHNTGSFDQLCNFSHKKFGSLYEYNLNSYITSEYSAGGLSAEFLTPVYFFSLPDSYSSYSNNKLVLTVNIANISGSGPIKLKLHSKDPRMNLSADYINNFTYGCTQDGSSLLYSDTDPNGQLIFNKGVLSSEDSILIEATSITDSGLGYLVYTYEITLPQINSSLLSQSQIKNTTRTSNGESLVLNDASKETYNSGVSIFNTIILSLCFQNKSYSIPQNIFNANYQIVGISANLVAEASTGSIFNQSLGSLYSGGVYNCIYNKVATYAYNTILNNCSSGEKIYTNPVLGLGTSLSSADMIYTGDIIDSYQMISVDKYNSFNAPDKITGSDLVGVTSLDLQPMKYLSLHMSTASVPPSGQMTLFTNSAIGINSNVNFSILSSVGVNSSTNLFLGPSTYSNNIPLYTRATKGGIIDGGTGESGSSTGDMGLNIPYTTTLIGTQLNSGVTLNLKTIDSGSQVNLFVKGPTANSGNTNLYILPRSYSLPEDMNLFAKASFIQSSASNLVMSGNSPGNLNLVLNGPTETNSLVPLIMFSPTSDSSGAISLVSYEIPRSEFPLYMRAPEIGSANTTLFTKYDLKYANSIDNTPSSSCEAYPNDVPFDITSGMAESLINGSNSISGPNYSTGEIFGYEPNQIPISQIDSDYKFYRYGRFQKVTDTNGSVLAVGIREGGRPKLLIFSLSGGQATLIEKKDPYVGLADSSQVFGDCLVLDVKVSTSGRIAFSSYIEIKNSFGQFVQGHFIIYLYNPDGSYLIDIVRSFADPSNDAFMANHMGMTLYWAEDESLIYTKEVGIVGTIQQRIAPNYDVEEFLFSADQMNDYAATYNHWLTGKMPFYRMAFGHRIQKFGDSLFITTPLFDGFASLNPIDSFRYPKFSGNISTFHGQGQDLWYNHTINEDTLFGYDMFMVDYYGEIGISSARDNSIWNTDISISGFNQNSSSDADFGISIDNCDRAIYSVLGSALYNLNGKSFSYSGIDDEIAPYIPSSNTILSKQEKIRGSVISGGLHLVFREFDVTYGFGTRTKFNKISLLKQSKKYETPTLFIKNQGLDSGINLTLETIKIKDSSINMSTGGVYDGQDGCSLFIRQIPDGGMDNALPLKLQGNDPVEWADQVGLALYGTFTSNTFFLSSPESTLFIGADNSFTNNIPLKILGPDSALLDNSIPLFMNMFPVSTVWQNATSPSLGINIMNTQTVEQNWQLNKGNSTLYLNSTYGTSGSLPLWIVRKGPGGGEELEASSNLTIKNKDTVSGVSLYTNAIYGIGNNVSLVFTPSAGTKNKDMKIQIFGYKE